MKQKIDETPVDTTGIIEQISCEEIASTGFAKYAKYIIQERALPDVRDGLKPVQRRILYAMYKGGIVHSSIYKKSAKAVGDIMANYHPHGDCLLGSTKVKMADNTTKTIEQLYEEGKEVEIYSINKDNKIVKATAHSFRIGQHTNKIYHIDLYDGRTLSATGNHPFLMLSDFEKEGHVWKKAEDIQETDKFYSGVVDTDILDENMVVKTCTGILNITIEEVDNIPMYDFTVDTHENMLLFSNVFDTFETFIVTHNSSIYGAMIRQGQDWIQNLPLIDVHGNNGSIDGDSPAAMRYTESRLEEVVSEAILKGIKKEGIVPMVNNFDDTTQEPTILPTRIPLGIVNGVTGISAGYATDIFPHNLSEVMKGLMYLYDNEDATTDELMAIIPAPDFPTGGYITGTHHYRSAFEDGKLATKGLKNRCKFHVDESDKKRDSIIVTEIPYGVNKVTITKKIEELCSLDKKDPLRLPALIEVADLTSKGEIMIKIDVEKGSDINLVMSYLFKKTALQIDKNKLQYLFISDKKPKTMGMKEILIEFNKFRKETVIKEITYDKEKLEAMLHITEGFIKLSDNLGEVVKVIETSTGKENASSLLVSVFDFSRTQADSIVSMALHRISKTDKEKYLAEKTKYEKGIKAYESILGSRVKLKNYILKQYEEVIEKYGTERKTQIIMEDENWEISKEDTIIDEDVYVGVSKKGYVKRSSLRSFSTTENPDYIEGDSPILEVKVSNKDVLMVFTSECNYMYLPIHSLEDVRWKSKGNHLGTIISQGLAEGEEVVNAFTINPETDSNKLIFTAKSDGKVKRTTVAEHIVIKKFSSSYPCIKSSVGDKLIQAQIVDGDGGFIGFKNNLDKTMFFGLDEVLPKGLKADGMRGILMKDDETIIDSLFNLDKEFLTTNNYNAKSRGGRATK